MRIQVVDRDGSLHDVPGEPGITLLEAIRNAGIDSLLALCGGCCSCATCHVIVDRSHPELFAPGSADEDDLLDGSDHRAPESRLACQIALADGLDGLSVAIAPLD